MLKRCPWNDDHNDQAAIVIQFHNGALSASCRHDGCSHENWKSLRDKYEPGWDEKKKSKKSEKNDDDSGNAADAIIEIARETELFKDKNNQTYSRFFINGHPETSTIHSESFSNWLKLEYWEYHGKVNPTEALTNAIGFLHADTCFNGKVREVFRRCAFVDNILYYDLCNDKREVVRITPDGWDVLTNCKVEFLRNKSMMPQVAPQATNESYHFLNKHYKFKNEESTILHFVSIVTKFLPHISHPIDVLYGEKGSSKSTTMSKDQKIVDPNACERTLMPKTSSDLTVTLYNNYYNAFDNLSDISKEQSDILCIASTGGTISKRALYSDNDMALYEIKRIVSLNGINVVAKKSDLLDRSLLLQLACIPDNERISDTAMWQSFEEDKPVIIGLIFNILVEALKIKPTVKHQNVSRMADFFEWGYAIAEAAGIGGEKFLQAYESNRYAGSEEAVLNHPVAYAIERLINNEKLFTGSATALLTKLFAIATAEGIDTRSHSWPSQPNQLSRLINDLKSNLEDLGMVTDIANRNIRIYQKLPPEMPKRTTAYRNAV